LELRLIGEPQCWQRIALGFGAVVIGFMKMRQVMTTVLSSSSVNQFAHDSAVISRSANPG